MSVGVGEPMTAAEHLAWAKQRALEVLDSGDVSGAYTSMVSDLQKHPELANHAGIMLGMMEQMGGHLSTPEKMRNHIEGYN